MANKLCKCGCGQPPAKNIVRGENKGWLKYAKGHEPKPAIRLCKCGCGQPAAKRIWRGIDTGWLKYAKGHQPAPKIKLCECGCGSPAAKKRTNGKTKYRKYAKGHYQRRGEPRLCKCGCGQLAAKNNKNGVDKGWLKYAKGHFQPTGTRDPKILAKAIKAGQAARLAKLPFGSRRIVKIYGKEYWQVKVEGRKRWPFEHRYIVEQRLGRQLLRSEHAHHRDNNGLNNGLHADGQDNLLLIPNSEHGKLTALTYQAEMCRCECPHCGAHLHHFKKLESPRTKRKPAKHLAA